MIRLQRRRFCVAFSSWPRNRRSADVRSWRRSWPPRRRASLGQGAGSSGGIRPVVVRRGQSAASRSVAGAARGRRKSQQSPSNPGETCGRSEEYGPWRSTAAGPALRGRRQANGGPTTVHASDRRRRCQPALSSAFYRPVLRQGQYDDATPWLEKLEDRMPADLGCRILATRWLCGRKRTVEIEPLVEAQHGTTRSRSFPRPGRNEMPKKPKSVSK